MIRGNKPAAAICCLAASLAGFSGQALEQEPGGGNAMYTVETPVAEVISTPDFGSFGRLLFPVNEGFWSGSTLGSLRLAWYTGIDPSMTVEICNYLRVRVEEGQTVFLDIYSEDEKRVDPAKRDTGLFFFRGRPGERTAILSAGGGFAYVGAMHDSFPAALGLAKRGYNAFALIYRAGARTAMEDLARAIDFIFDHAGELQVSTDGYSLWGGSAGARMAAVLGELGPEGFGGTPRPHAAAVISLYTGYSACGRDDRPTFSCVGEDDHIAGWRTVKSRLECLNSLGIDTEFHSYPGIGHGFGLGTGTVAEGWINLAVSFWERQARK